MIPKSIVTYRRLPRSFFQDTPLDDSLRIAIFILEIPGLIMITIRIPANRVVAVSEQRSLVEGQKRHAQYICVSESKDRTVDAPAFSGDTRLIY